MKAYLDDTDLDILRILQADGRISNADLAKKIGLSPASTFQRVRNLEAAGFIRRYVALVDHEKVGKKLTVLAMVELSLHQDQPIERFRRAVMQIPEVLECYNVSGEFDFVLKIVVPDMRSYEALVREKLSTIRGVGKVTSSFVLSTTKHTTAVPI